MALLTDLVFPDAHVNFLLPREFDENVKSFRQSPAGL